MATKHNRSKQLVKKINPILSAFVKKIEPLPLQQVKPSKVKESKLNEKYVMEQPFKSLLALSIGKGNQDDWRAVSFRIFAGIEMATYFNQEKEIVDTLDFALDQIDALHNFHAKYNKYFLFPEETDIINSALILVEQLHLLCSDISIASIYRTVEDRIRAMK
jgi:hypothetical protein